ncbi:helix-turn-helix domain-containing protein [Carboxylicivirga sp. RSCT41]|uniref:helix-turn-helix domain-containing protein n=1 Tax=Carboxylicivirga agarovorans TaxID=3417570 RepID=UPI003D342AB0
MNDYLIQLELSLFSLADIFSFTTALVLGVLFLTVKSDNRRANVFLSLFLFSLGGEVFSVLGEQFVHEDQRIFQSSLFTMPLLLLYVRRTINRSNSFYILLLLIPGCVFNMFDISVVVIEYVFNSSILAYLLYYIRRHQRGLKSYYSNLERLTLKWIRVIIIIFLGFHVLWIIEDFAVLQNESFEYQWAGLSSLLTFFTILWIGHNGFSQPEIFKQKLFIQPIIDEEAEGSKAYAKQDEDSERWTKLNMLVQEQRLYTNPKLNLRMLSDISEIGEKEVSRLINQQEQCNFYSYINRFRVDEFKRLLNSERAGQLSMLGLAEEAGFNSKSTFYTVFKSLEGQTPSQYKASMSKSG